MPVQLVQIVAWYRPAYERYRVNLFCCSMLDAHVRFCVALKHNKEKRVARGRKLVN